MSAVDDAGTRDALASQVMLAPSLRHRLALVVRLVDGFTGEPVREPFDVRLAGHEWWTPRFATDDATYRFQISNQPVPALGQVDLVVTSLLAAPTYRDVGGPQVAIPRPGPVPVPLVASYYRVDRPLWPTWAFRPFPGETFVVGHALRAGQPVPDLRVRVATTNAALAAAPAAPTDADGQFVYRLPGLRASAATPATIRATADLLVAVDDAAGAAQALAGPALPVTVPLGRTASLTLDLA